MVGRERELERLRGALESVVGGTGRLVLLSGEAGAGKTRLAEDLARAARERGARVAWGRCWVGEGAPALWPWLQIIRVCLRSVDEPTLRDLVGPHASELTALVAPAGATDPRAATAIESPAGRFRVFNAIAHFLAAYAERTPLVIILDDLQRADDSSLLLLQFFTQEQRERRILLIATYREPGAAPNRALTQAVVEATREPGTERINLGGLTEAETAKLLRSLLDAEPSPELTRVLSLRTGGNPLFLTEYARQMRGHGEAGDLPVPAEVREVIEQRLSLLSAADRAVLRLAALLGNELSRDDLGRLATTHLDGEAKDVGAALAEAERLGLLMRASGAGRHRFAQDMVREVLAEEVPPAQRAEPLQTPAAAAPAEPAPVAVEVPAPASFVFRKEGEYWTLSFAGQVSRVKDVKGLAYVALLLRYPRKPLHVTELASLGGGANGAESELSNPDDSTTVRLGLGDAGAVLDEQAKVDYRRRLDDLRCELEQATAFQDKGRAERLQEEIEFLSQELSAAVGLGGRVRRAGSHVERARVNVTRSIARAVEKMGETHPQLADYLSRTIRTGTFCTYVPDSSQGADWEL